MKCSIKKMQYLRYETQTVRPEATTVCQYNDQSEIDREWAWSTTPGRQVSRAGRVFFTRRNCSINFNEFGGTILTSANR